MRPLLALGLMAVLVLAGCVDPQAQGSTVDALSTGPGDGYAPVLDLASRIETAVAADAPLNVTAFYESDPLGRGLLGAPVTVSVRLQPSAVLAAAPWAEVDGTRVDFPNVRAYEGRVDGRDDGFVRLTLTKDWARGTIRINDTQLLIREGLLGNLPHPTPSMVRPPANAYAYDASTETRFFDPGGQEGHDCIRPVPSDVTPMVEPLPGPTTKSMLTARIVLDADAQAKEMLGDDLFPMMVAFLNEVDSIYEHEVGIRLQLVGVHQNSDPEYYPDPAERAPLRKLAEYWNARPDVPRDVVHMFTGQPSNFAQANCIGGAGMPELAYTFTPLNWARDTVVFHEQAMAHELGHIFSAHHHYGNHVEAMWGSAAARAMGQGVGVPAQAGLATIMIQGYTPGSKPVFGTMEKSVIRGWAENHLGKHDA